MYNVDGFCEKNRDKLYKDLIVLMRQSSRYISFSAIINTYAWTYSQKSSGIHMFPDWKKKLNDLKLYSLQDDFYSAVWSAAGKFSQPASLG